MESSVLTTIEKIKLQEHDKEIVLKEKRELEATISSLNRAIRDTVAHTEKTKTEITDLQKKTHDLNIELALTKVRRDALEQQVKHSEGVLRELGNCVNRKISQVLETRSNWIQTVHSTTDKYDIVHLINRPLLEPTVRITEPEVPKPMTLLYEGRLKNALKRRDELNAERTRMMNEPEFGEEFVRIKNALRYSMDMVNNLKKVILSKIVQQADLDFNISKY